MADNVENAAPEDGAPATPVTNVQEPQYTPAEQEALAQGWVPEDQWAGSGKWRTAEDFLDRGKLFTKIDEQSRKIKSTEAVVNELKVHLKKVRETEYKRALNSLRAEKKNALDDGDTARVVEIDEQIAETKAEQTEELTKFDRSPAEPQAPNPQFVVWLNRNPWYQNDRAMHIYADTLGEDLARRGMPPNDILVEVERQTKKEFAHKFQNPNRGKPGSVEGGGSKGSTRAEAFELSPEETQVMNKFVKAGVLTKEEYIADIKAERARGA